LPHYLGNLNVRLYNFTAELINSEAMQKGKKIELYDTLVVINQSINPGYLKWPNQYKLLLGPLERLRLGEVQSRQ